MNRSAPENRSTHFYEGPEQDSDGGNEAVAM